MRPLTKQLLGLASLLALLAPAVTAAELVVSEIHYAARLSDSAARFVVEFTVENPTGAAASLTLFTGEVAVTPPTRWPAGWRLAHADNAYRLIADRAGRHTLRLELVARVHRAEPWSEIQFDGPAAAIGQLTAHAAGGDIEWQLRKGTLLSTTQQADSSVLRGVLGAERAVALRWRSQAAAAARRALVTCATTATAEATPTVIKFTTRFDYEILQGAVGELRVALPADQALTRVMGEQIRDWQVIGEPARVLVVEFIKPVERAYTLTLLTEQTVETTPVTTQLAPPAPLEVERETGTFAVSVEDVVVETTELTGLRRSNATAEQWAAFQFFARPFALGVRLERMQPVLRAHTRVTATLEESRLLVAHQLELTVEKAGLYAITLGPLTGFTVVETAGDGIEEWRVAGDELVIRFSRRALGRRVVEVRLERPLAETPAELTLTPLRVAGAERETAQIGVAPGPGLRVWPRSIDGAREIPVEQLTAPRGELLAFAALRPDWRVSLNAARLESRVIADVFHLVTVGDGLVGGSASIRYVILNQGVREFRVRLPAHWRNVEFTGPNIRRQDRQDDVWVIGLQEKAWGGYTLVMTYDFPFEPRGATLRLGGAEPLDVERVSSSLAVMSAANLQIAAPPAAAAQPGTHRIDESELAAADRALATRPVLLAYRSSGGADAVELAVTRFEPAASLQAVADRTQLTTVLTEAGQLLTQASFMVKNNDKQFQRFRLSPGAEFWGCYVDGAGVAAERDGDAVLVPLRRAANRDQAFAVEIVYAEKIGALRTGWRQPVRLVAPETDVHTTYAEWELYVPVSHELTGFGGNLIVARGTTYGLRDAWRECVRFYDNLYRETRGLLLVGGAVAGFGAVLVLALRQRWRWVRGLVAVGFVALVFGGMLLPALNSAREKARSANAVSNLRQVGLSLAMFADMNEERLPDDLGQLLGTVTSSEKVFVDPQSGESFVYVGRGQKWSASPETVLAYSPTEGSGGRAVLFGDGHVEFVPAARARELIAHAAGGGPAPAPEPVAPGAPVLATPAVAGIRPIRIDVPKVGTRYTFTKALNVTREPLTVQATAIQSTVRSGLQGAAVLAGFLAGWALIAWQLRRPSWNVTWLTLGLALVIASVAGALIVARWLGLALLLTPPLAATAAVVALGRVWWRRRRAALVETAVPPVLAALALLLCASAAPAAGPATIQSALYTGLVRETVAEWEAEFVIEADAVPREGVLVPLFGNDVAVREIVGASGGWFGRADVALVRQADGVAARVRKAGRTTVRVNFLVTPTGDVARRQLAFAIPPALASRLDATILEADASVETPTAVAAETVSRDGRTRLTAELGAANRVELAWTPRVKRSADIAATAFAQNHALITVGVGVINTRAWLDYQVTQGELRELRVALPAGQRLLRVVGAGIRAWNVARDGAEPVLHVELIKGVAPAYRLMLETEQNVAAEAGSDFTAAWAIPRALDVRRETGMIALRGVDELALTATAAGLQQADAEEFLKVAPDAGPVETVAAAYRFLRPGFVLALTATALQPQVEAVARHQIRVGRQQITVVSQVDYTIQRAGLFAVTLAAPADYRILAVTGPHVARWTELADAAGRRVVVTFRERTLGATSVKVQMQQWFADGVTTAPAVGAQPLGARKLTGFVVVATELGVQARAGAVAGLVDVPVSAVGGGATGQLAFRFIQHDSTARAPWSLTLEAEQAPPLIRAEVVNWLTLNPAELGWVRGRSVVRYDIQNAPTSVFHLRVPAGFKNVEISGDRMRQRDQDGQDWRVELQGPVAGTYQLTVTWELAAPVGAARTALWAARGIEALQVERETGLIAVIAPAPLQVTPVAAPAELLAVDERELPAWAGSSAEPPVLVYRYLRPGYELELRAQRFAAAPVLQALIDQAQFTSVVAEDGQMMTELRFEIRNNGRQYLALVLPAGAEVWSAFVAGQAVRPGQHEGQLLVPLERSGPTGAPITVELTYVNAVPFPARRGAVALSSPTVDIPLKNARWDVFLPPDYEYRGFGGSMTHVEEAAVTTRMHSFSVGDYLKSEGFNTAAARSQYAQDVEQAAAELGRGNVKSANELFRRAARAKDQGGAGLDRDEAMAGKARGVETTLREAQALNVMAGQEQALSNYAAQSGSALPAPAAAQPADKRSAAAQWDKLQQAQQVAEVKLSPLRVNLPSRGLRYAFTQTLQTEVGQPMTVMFAAAESRGVGVASAVGLGAAGFVALWLLVAACAARRG